MSERPETEATAATRSPGEILKRAREGKSLSVAAIATQLNLDIRTVEALEQGDPAKLPAPIFVRGYLRGYARLVDVREDEVLDIYRAQAPQEPTPRPIGMARAPMRPAFRASTFPWRSLFGVILLVMLAVLAFEFGPRLIEQLMPQQTVGDTGTASDLELALPGADEGAPGEPTTAVPLPLPEPDPVPVDERQPVAPAEPEPDLPGDADFGTLAPTETIPQSPAPAPEAAPAPPPGEVQMEFRFADDSWVEVLDAARNRLVFGLLRKGDARSVTGVAPISVLLGNAAAVEVRVGGEAFDHARYSRDNVARFRIDGNS
jgi:cytoskeleton protein RodZ